MLYLQIKNYTFYTFLHVSVNIIKSVFLFFTIKIIYIHITYNAKKQFKILCQVRFIYGCSSM